jgi:hypothetical protein
MSSKHSHVPASSIFFRNLAMFLRKERCTPLHPTIPLVLLWLHDLLFYVYVCSSYCGSKKRDQFEKMMSQKANCVTLKRHQIYNSYH